MAGGAFTDNLDVSIGAYTKASDYDKVADNTEFCREKANIEHDLAIGTGTGKHRRINAFITDAAAAAVQDMLSLEWDPASGTPAVGQGIGISYKLSNLSNAQIEFANLCLVATNVTAGAERARWDFMARVAGTLTNVFSVGGDAAQKRAEVNGDFQARFDSNSATATVATLANRDVTAGTAHGIQLNFEFARTGSASALIGGIIRAGKAQEWTSTATTQDSFMAFFTAIDGVATERMRIDHLGALFIGDNSNAKQTIGLTINQGANDDAIIDFKSSDVGHNMTTEVEADTYGRIVKAEATSGGLCLEGYKDADGNAYFALQLQGRLGEAADATKTTSGGGIIGLVAQVTNGAGSVTAAAANANLVTIANSGTTKFIFDADGDAHADVSWTTFDVEDDVAVLRDLEAALLPAQFGDTLRYNRRELERLGIIGAGSWQEKSGRMHAMINFSRLAMLHHGAIRQVNESLSARIEHLERKLLAA